MKSKLNSKDFTDHLIFLNIAKFLSDCKEQEEEMRWNFPLLDPN